MGKTVSTMVVGNTKGWRLEPVSRKADLNEVQNIFPQVPD